jgi:hypothetical protein
MGKDPDGMEDDLDDGRPKDIFKERCSVTAFDLEVFVSEDGRKRGLWVGAGDVSKERMQQFEPALKGALEAWLRAKTSSKPNPIGEASYYHDILLLFRDSMKEMGLLEWPEVAKLHKALGKALKNKPKEEY